MINTSIAHYKITSKLGQGGMAECPLTSQLKLVQERMEICMKTNLMTRLFPLAVLAMCFSPALFAESAPSNWPQFRGPNGSGIADDARPPIHFGPDTNVRWKIAVPSGISAPIVWGDRIVLTALADKELITLSTVGVHLP